eukprot:1932082-Alexandrium_andersonii.AAC.1
MSDLRVDLRPALERLSPGEPLALGPDTGNVNTKPLDSLADADGLVSGPPCPPYSSIGLRKLEADARSTVLGT